VNVIVVPGPGLQMGSFFNIRTALSGQQQAPCKGRADLTFSKIPVTDVEELPVSSYTGR
jgi:hypothetical protein